MMQRNSPLMQLGAMLAYGKTPQQAVQILAKQNPQVQQAMQMLSGKNPAELEQIARNMAKERGTTIEDIARSLGIQIPSNR